MKYLFIYLNNLVAYKNKNKLIVSSVGTLSTYIVHYSVYLIRSFAHDLESTLLLVQTNSKG